MNQPLLNGEVVNHDEELTAMREQIADLEVDLQTARAEAAREKRNAALAMGNLRRQLSPLYQALHAVFGELDAAGIAETSAPTGGNGSTAKWDYWKKRFPGNIAAAIDVLLIQGGMTQQELATAIRCAKETVRTGVIYPMNKAGIIVKSGSRYSLKEQ